MRSTPTYAVTGAAGFIGSHLTRALVRQGQSVRAIDALLTSSSWWRLRDIAGSVDLVTCDIQDPDQLGPILNGVDYVFHVAGVPEPVNVYSRLAQCHHANAAADIQFLETALHSDVRKVVLSSSCAVYSHHPGAEGQWDGPSPCSLNGLSKRIAEKAARFCASHFGLNVVALRYSEVYGEAQRPDPWLAPVAAIASAVARGVVPFIAGDPLAERDFVHVDDVVRANLVAMERSLRPGSALDIGSGESLSLHQIVHHVAQTGVPPSTSAPRYRQARNTATPSPLPNLRMAEIELGYASTIRPHDGIAGVAAWYRRNGEFSA